jgi:hypothetical protein
MTRAQHIPVPLQLVEDQHNINFPGLRTISMTEKVNITQVISINVMSVMRGEVQSTKGKHIKTE